jgi:5-methylcytosine-specific restriction protein A
MCTEQGHITIATVVDHVTEHKGNEELFFDPANLQSLCKPHHDGAKQRQEHRGYVIGIDASGRPIDASHAWNR